MTKHTFTKKSFLIILLGFFLAFLLTYILFSFFQQGKITDDSLTLSAHWDLQINDTVYSDVNLSDTLFPETNMGDVVTMSGVLPDTKVEHAELVIFTCHSTLEVWLDGESIYSFGAKRYNEKLLLGYGNHYLELPSDYAGKKLTIRMNVSENHAFTSITSPTISDGYTYQSIFMRANIVPFFIGIFLMIFGITFLFLSVVMFSISGKFFPLLQIAFIAICIGMWTFCNYHLMQLFTPYYALCAYLEYGSLYIVPIPVMLYFNSSVHSSKNRLLSLFYRGFLITHTIFIVTSFTCQCLNILHLPAFLQLFHALCVVMLFLILVTTFVNLKTQTLESRLLICGLLIFALFGSFDLVRFNLEKYTRFFLREDFNGLLPIGAVIFILFLSVSFCVQLTHSLYSQAKQELLEHQAYTDSMTGLSNRRRCEEEMRLLEQSCPKKTYGIISFDLNNLKQTNDSLGHEYGDQLIVTFSRLLCDIFSPYGLIGRMGGDEFMVMISDISICDVDELITTLMDRIQTMNRTLTKYHISTSYGYATGTSDTTIFEVYQLADKRMYEYKRRYKGKSQEPELFPGI